MERHTYYWPEYVDIAVADALAPKEAILSATIMLTYINTPIAPNIIYLPYIQYPCLKVSDHDSGYLVH